MLEAHQEPEQLNRLIQMLPWLHVSKKQESIRAVFGWSCR